MFFGFSSFYACMSSLSISEGPFSNAARHLGQFIHEKQHPKRWISNGRGPTIFVKAAEFPEFQWRISPLVCGSLARSIDGRPKERPVEKETIKAINAKRFAFFIRFLPLVNVPEQPCFCPTPGASQPASQTIAPLTREPTLKSDLRRRENLPKTSLLNSEL